MTTNVLERRLLTLRETASALRCSERTVRRMIEDGRVPALRLGGPGTSLRVDESELARWLFADVGPVAHSNPEWRGGAGSARSRSAAAPGPPNNKETPR